MVEIAREVLAKVERGELTGLMLIASTLNGDDVTGIYGSYADRLQYAVYSATKALNGLMDKVSASEGIGYSASGALTGQITGAKYGNLPWRLMNG